jgi:glutamyl-tRNA synthetase
VFGIDELTAAFGLDRVQSSAAQMDLKKLEWMNGEHMRRLAPADYQAGIRADLEQSGTIDAGTDPQYVRSVIDCMGDRIKRWSDASEMTGYFFSEDFPFDEKAVSKRLLKEGALERLGALRNRFAALASFDHDALEQALQAQAEELGVSAGQLIHPVRVATSGTGFGPSLYEMLEVLGRDRVLARIDRAIARFG